MQVVLVHSPLVGPTTWRRLADALTASGHDVAAPDLRTAALSGSPTRFVDAVVDGVDPDWSHPILVGHSGAGAFLPSIGSRLCAARTVFVDAGIPAHEPTGTVGGDFLGHLRSIAVDGVLPLWSTWWGDGVMEVLVPDRVRRAEVEAELPAVPLALYEASIEHPPGSTAVDGAYLLLSEAYRADADQARSLGWPVIERLGTHLDIVNEPEAIATSIIELTTLPIDDPY